MPMMSPPTNTVTNPEVELFLQHNPVEPHAATRLRSLPMEMQKIVLSRGSLFGGRDPTAVLLGRIRAATRGLTGAQIGTSHTGAAAPPGAPGGPAPGQRMPWSGSSFMPDGPDSQPQTSAPMPATDGPPQAAWAKKEAWETETFGVEEQRKARRPPPPQQSMPPPPMPPPVPENPEMQQMRGMMQNRLGELSTELLGKNAAQSAGLIEQSQAQSKSAPALNPFRSKARVAPVANEPDPAPMDTPGDFNRPIYSSDMPQDQQQNQWQQQPMDQQHQGQQQVMSMGTEPGHNDMPPGLPTLPDLPAGLAMPGMPPPPGSGPGGMDRPPPPPAKEEEKRLWAPSAQDLADLGIPPGIAVRMIRENQILADEDNMPIIPYEGTPLGGEGIGELDDLPRTGGDGSQASAGGAAAVEDSASAKKGKDLDKGDADMKRAQAVATLSYYGLTDPTSQEDLATAVQAVAAATGEQATAVALWHMISGTSDGTPATTLTDEQIVEVQQAAQHAQYSQYWLQQQFQSQLAMFENQRLMATGDNPVTNVDDARESALRGPRGDPAVSRGGRKPSTTQPMLPGDWTCPGCGDHQFARNRVCRFCGASRPLGNH